MSTPTFGTPENVYTLALRLLEALKPWDTQSADIRHLAASLTLALASLPHDDPVQS